jgi:hypothetical protein
LADEVLPAAVCESWSPPPERASAANPATPAATSTSAAAAPSQRDPRPPRARRVAMEVTAASS